MDQFGFSPINRRPWSGRYTRVAGDAAVFHVRHVDRDLRAVIEWNINGDRCMCVALHDPDVKQLVANVVQAKAAMGGLAGGSFQINEFGQVLVPASDGCGLRMLVGETRGSLRFDHPYEDRTFTLAESSGLTSGDAWQLPYVGMPFNLSRLGRVLGLCLHWYARHGKVVPCLKDLTCHHWVLVLRQKRYPTCWNRPVKVAICVIRLTSTRISHRRPKMSISQCMVRSNSARSRTCWPQFCRNCKRRGCLIPTITNILVAIDSQHTDTKAGHFRRNWIDIS